MIHLFDLVFRKLAFMDVTKWLLLNGWISCLRGYDK
jgi:hypothetical protein